MSAISVREHEFEPTPGLPGELPDGEYIIWQGRPSARIISREVLKTRWLAGYFIALALWAAIAGYHDGRDLGSIAFSVGVLAIMATLLIGMLELFAWGVEKTSLYTITNCRLVMRIGVALSLTLNLPFSRVAGAAVQTAKKAGKGAAHGNIALSLKKGPRLSWMLLWPHSRAWHFNNPQPTLVGLRDVAKVSQILAAELTRSHQADLVAGEETAHVGLEAIERAPRAIGPNTQGPIKKGPNTRSLGAIATSDADTVGTGVGTMVAG